MNAVMQCITHTCLLSNMMLEKVHKCSKSDCFLCNHIRFIGGVT